MSIANVSLADTFDFWRTKTNQLIYLFNQIATGNLGMTGTLTLTNEGFYEGNNTLNVTNGVIRVKSNIFDSNVVTVISNTTSIVIDGSGQLGSKLFISMNTATSPTDASSINVATAAAVNTVQLQTIAAYGHSNLVNAATISGFDKANTACTKADAAQALGGEAYDKANSANYFAYLVNANTVAAFAAANASPGSASFDKANTANVMAYWGFARANSANTVAIANVNYVNTAMQAAFSKANTACTSAAAASTAAGAAFGKANTACTSADAASTAAGAAFGRANTANTVAIANVNYVNTAMQAAFSKANSALANSSGTFNGDLFINGNLKIQTAISGNAFATATTQINCAFSNYFTRDFSAGGSATITFIKPPSNQTFGFVLKAINGGNATITWANTPKWPSATAPTLSSGEANVDVLVFFTEDGGTTWRGVLSMRDSH